MQFKQDEKKSASRCETASAPSEVYFITEEKRATLKETRFSEHTYPHTSVHFLQISNLNVC